jgi:hypothetical protein
VVNAVDGLQHTPPHGAFGTCGADRPIVFDLRCIVRKYWEKHIFVINEALKCCNFYVNYIGFLEYYDPNARRINLVSYQEFRTVQCNNILHSLLCCGVPACPAFLFICKTTTYPMIEFNGCERRMKEPSAEKEIASFEPLFEHRPLHTK